VKRLADEDDVEAVTVGTNVGTLRTDYDWILDVQLPDRGAAERFLKGEEYLTAMREVALVTKYEWTARLTHTMHGH
jgi:hypothetical protein